MNKAVCCISWRWLQPAVLQSPCSATPACFRPSLLWTASASRWSVRRGSCACPARPRGRKVSSPRVAGWVKANQTRFNGPGGSAGDLRVVLYEKSCVLPVLCGVTGEKYALGLNFTFINECCNTHLCNTAGPPAGPPLWTALLPLLPLLALGSARWTEEHERIMETNREWILLIPDTCFRVLKWN